MVESSDIARQSPWLQLSEAVDEKDEFRRTGKSVLRQGTGRSAYGVPLLAWLLRSSLLEMFNQP